MTSLDPDWRHDKLVSVLWRTWFAASTQPILLWMGYSHWSSADTVWFPLMLRFARCFSSLGRGPKVLLCTHRQAYWCIPGLLPPLTWSLQHSLTAVITAPMLTLVHITAYTIWLIHTNQNQHLITRRDPWDTAVTNTNEFFTSQDKYHTPHCSIVLSLFERAAHVIPARTLL
jgi:hypothetical protein